MLDWYLVNGYDQLTLFYTEYLTNVFYTGEGGKNALQPTVMVTPKLVCGLVFAKLF